MLGWLVLTACTCSSRGCRCCRCCCCCCCCRCRCRCRCRWCRCGCGCRCRWFGGGGGGCCLLHQVRQGSRAVVAAEQRTHGLEYGLACEHTRTARGKGGGCHQSGSSEIASSCLTHPRLTLQSGCQLALVAMGKVHCCWLGVLLNQAAQHGHACSIQRWCHSIPNLAFGRLRLIQAL